MPSPQVLQIGKRLLGIYFFVHGLMLFAGVLGVFGLEVPGGSGRIGLVAATATQGLIAIVAATVLFRASVDATTDVPQQATHFDVPVLQLLGVYFLIEGLWAVTRPTVAIAFYSTAWQTRVSDIVGGLLAALAGLLLIARPSATAESLRKFRAA